MATDTEAVHAAGPQANLPAPSPVLTVRVETPPDEIDRFTRFIERMWRPWLGALVLVGWTWQLTTVHIVPWFALAFWHYTLPKFEGFSDNELQYLTWLTVAIFGIKGFEKVWSKKIDAQSGNGK